MDLNKQIELLKKAIEKTTKFDDEQEKIDYILDVTSEYKQLMLGGVVGRSEQFYCVSSDALVYGKPCKKWCGDEHCKALCKQ